MVFEVWVRLRVALHGKLQDAMHCLVSSKAPLEFNTRCEESWRELLPARLLLKPLSPICRAATDTLKLK